jgi:hypothetical protein
MPTTMSTMDRELLDQTAVTEKLYQRRKFEEIIQALLSAG